MKLRTVLFIISLTAGLSSGCFMILPTDALSSLVLNPGTSCEQLATGLGLGQFPLVTTPDEASLQFEAFSATSANGEQLSGWYVPAQLDGQLDDSPVGTVLIMHGTDGSLACTLPWLLVAANNHMHVVAFDYQGYGDSTGTPNIATQLDDSEAVLNWVLAEDAAARQQVHLLGISLGTGPALGLAALRSRPQTQSVALDGAYDPEAMAAAVEPQLGPIFPLTGVSIRVGFAWLFDMKEQLDEMTTPAIFLHAENDPITPQSGAETMFNLMGSQQKSLWVFGNLTHIQPLFLSTEEYISLLVTFWRSPAVGPSSDASETDATIRVPSFAL